MKNVNHVICPIAIIEEHVCPLAHVVFLYPKTVFFEDNVSETSS